MHSKILINEFLPDPEGVDSQVLQEWVEIVNTSEEEIDISGWDIQVAGRTYSRVFVFPQGSIIKPGQYILACEPLVPNCDYYSTKAFGIQNGGKETDGIRIRNSQGEVMDTVLYDTTNSNELLNDFGDIEKDENIIEMPPAGCSLARRNFLDTNFSIKDFFVTCKPTPGTKNIEISNIVISEVYFNFIEFYSTNIPTDLEKWYVKESKESSEKIFLSNVSKNNFFVLKIPKPLKNIYLYAPENILKESFERKEISKNFSFCRLNSKIDENFDFCEITEGEKNEKKTWTTLNLLEIIQQGVNNSYITNTCVMYKHGEIFVISDESAALGVKCGDCVIDKCHISEIFFEKNNMSNLSTLEETEKMDIPIEKVKAGNYSSLFNKIVIFEGEYLKTDSEFSYFLTEIGEVKILKGDYSKNYEYTFKGILEKDSSIRVDYAVLMRQESSEKIQTLEKTGDPLILIFVFLLIPFFIFQIFAKLTTIKLFHKITS